MQERRSNTRTRARIPCNLMLSASGKRFSGCTTNISLRGVEFEASESMTRAGQAVTPGSVGMLSISFRRGGNFDVLKLPCRVNFVAANSAGLEFTTSLPTPGELATWLQMINSGSNRVD